MNWYPLRFKNIFEDKIWGGKHLTTLFGEKFSNRETLGESWEVSAVKTNPSIVLNGELKGKSLSELMETDSLSILGNAKAGAEGAFPLLVKLIDANDKLSVQVHPDDIYANKNENGSAGKTESWYVVHADPGAKIICGLKNKASKEELENALKIGTILNYLDEFEVNTGDVVHIPAGTIHALEAGLVIYEVQETSDITYRFYDWGRMGDDGKPRELHIEKALEVSDLEPNNCIQIPKEVKSDTSLLVECPYFNMEKVIVKKEKKIHLNSNFNIITCLSGSGKIENEEIKAGETLLIPAACLTYKMYGDMTLIITEGAK